MLLNNSQKSVKALQLSYQRVKLMLWVFMLDCHYTLVSSIIHCQTDLIAGQTESNLHLAALRKLLCSSYYAFTYFPSNNAPMVDVHFKQGQGFK